MPGYRFTEKDTDMCDNLAQVWALAENRELHFKDVKDAEKPEVVSDLIQKQRQISNWLYDVKSKNGNRQEAWEHLQEVGGICRTYLAQMQDPRRIKNENIIYAGSQPGTTRSVGRLLRGNSRAQARSDEFVSSFVDMVDQANQYGIIGPEDEIRIQQNLQTYRSAIIHKNGRIAALPRPARASQEEMDRFVGEYDPELDQELENLEKEAEEPEKRKIPPVPAGPGPVKVEDVPDDNYQRLREAREKVQAQHEREQEEIRRENARLKAEAERLRDEAEVRAMNERLKAEAVRLKEEHDRQQQHQREEDAIREENARLKAEAERLRAEQKRAEREKWVQHEKEEEEIRAMNERLKAKAVQIKNEQQRKEREQQEREARRQKAEQEREARQRKTEQEREARRQKAEQEREAQRQKAEQEREAQRQKAQPEPPKHPVKEEKGIQAGEEPKAAKEKEKTRKTRLQPVVAEHLAFHAAQAPRIQTVQGLMNRLQYSERILQNVAARLEWMQQHPMNQMPYTPLMNSFQRSMAVPVFQSVLQYQNMPQYQNMAAIQTAPQYQNASSYRTNPQMAYRGTQMNYGNPMNPQTFYQNSYMGGQPVQSQKPYRYGQPMQSQNLYMYSQPMQNQNLYRYSQPVQNQNSYMYGQPMQNQNPYMYTQPMQSQNPYMYAQPEMNRQMEKIQMAYMLQNMSLVKLALTYAGMSIRETYHQVKDWLNEWVNQKNPKTEQKVSEAARLKEQKAEKAASKSSGKRRVRFKELEKQENLVSGKTEKKKIPMTMERKPLTRQKERGLSH